MIKTYGRSYELGLAAGSISHTNRCACPGWPAWVWVCSPRSRMNILPKRIKHMDQLKAIMAKAKTLELNS